MGLLLTGVIKTVHTSFANLHLLPQPNQTQQQLWLVALIRYFLERITNHAEIHINSISYKWHEECDWSHDPHWREHVDLCTHLPSQSPPLSSFNVLSSLLCVPVSVHDCMTACHKYFKWSVINELLVIFDANSYPNKLYIKTA